MKREHVMKWFPGSSTRPEGSPVLLVRDLPDLRYVEDQFILYGGDRASDAAQQWAETTFGVGRAQAEFGITFDDQEIVLTNSVPASYLEGSEDEPDDDDYDDEDCDDDEDRGIVIRRHQQKLQTRNAGDIEIVEFLLPLGVDLRDEQGRPLLCTRAIGVQVECAARGLFGKLPERDAGDLHRMENWLTNAREEFLSGRRRRSP